MNYLFYFLSRIFSNLILPPSLPIILLLIGILKRKNKYIFCSLIFFVILSSRIFSEILIRYVEYPWQYKQIDEIPQSEYVVVLSGGMKNLNSINNNFEWNDPDRFFAGLKILKSGKAKKIIFTGAKSPFKKTEKLEGAILKEEAITLGVNPIDIVVTNPVFNTFQEAKAIKFIFKNKKNPRIILVTSAFHMNRAKYIFNNENISVIPFPVDFKKSNLKNFQIIKNPLNWIPNAENFYISSLIFKEIIGRYYYYLYYLIKF